MARSSWPALQAAMPSWSAFSASVLMPSTSRGGAACCAEACFERSLEANARVTAASTSAMRNGFSRLLDAVALLHVVGDTPAIDRADHHDGDVPVLRAPLDAPRHVEAVHLGEHGIQDDQIRHVFFHEAQREEAAIGLDHAVALVGQQTLQEAADVFLVVDDEHELARPVPDRRGGRTGTNPQILFREGRHARDLGGDVAEVAGLHLGLFAGLLHRLVDDDGRIAGRHRRSSPGRAAAPACSSRAGARPRGAARRGWRRRREARSCASVSAGTRGPRKYVSPLPFAS